MTPEELWKEATRGSQRAWESLYGLLGGKLYQFFLKNTSNQELAMDKTQEVFERLFRHRESFTEGSLKTWMFRIARNLLIDHWRKKGHKVDLFGEETPEIPDDRVDVETGVLAKIQHQEMVTLIDESLPGLNEENRMVIGLVYLGGLAIPELAQVMEVPLGTAKTRVRQARLKLEEIIREKIKNRGEARSV